MSKMVNSPAYCLHQDALGSTRLVTNGAILAFSSNFEPYGANYAMPGSEVYHYTGTLMYVGDGLYYEGARYYDPATRRFDPLPLSFSNSAKPATRSTNCFASSLPALLISARHRLRRGRASRIDR